MHSADMSQFLHTPVEPVYTPRLTGGLHTRQKKDTRSTAGVLSGPWVCPTAIRCP